MSGPLLPASSINTEAERAVLGGILSGAAFDFSQLTPEDFFSPLCRRLYKRFQDMDAMGETINTLAAIEPLRLDEVEAAAVHGFDDPLNGPFTPANMTSYARLVRRNARHRKLLNACELFLNAEADIPLRSAEIGAAARAYLDASVETASEMDPAKWLELFHTPQEFLTVPPLSFSIEGFLQNDGSTMIGGLSGHMKTFIMLSMVKALLAGKGTKLWDLFPVLETAERILYLIPECSLAPFVHRLKLMHLLQYTQNERLLVRTLNMGAPPLLQDPRLLCAAKGSHVFLDTAMRFTTGDESKAADVSQGLAKDLFALTAAGTRATVAAHHSPKQFAKDNQMTLENVLRGSGDVGAMLSTAWAVKLIDPINNVVHIENVKPRDFQPCGPFQLIARPWIDDTGDFKMYKRPDECGNLSEEQPNERNRERQEQKADRVAMVNSWFAADPKMSVGDMIAKFKEMGIAVKDRAVYAYRKEALKD